MASNLRRSLSVQLAGLLTLVGSLTVGISSAANAAPAPWTLYVVWDEVEFSGLDDCGVLYTPPCDNADLYSSMSVTNVAGSTGGRGGTDLVRNIGRWGGTFSDEMSWSATTNPWSTVDVSNNRNNVAVRYRFADRLMCETDSYANDDIDCPSADAWAKNKNRVQIKGYQGDAIRVAFDAWDDDSGSGDDRICNISHSTIWTATDIARLSSLPSRTQNFYYSGGTSEGTCYLKYRVILGP